MLASPLPHHCPSNISSLNRSLNLSTSHYSSVVRSIMGSYAEESVPPQEDEITVLVTGFGVSYSLLLLWWGVAFDVIRGRTCLQF